MTHFSRTRKKIEMGWSPVQITILIAAMIIAALSLGLDTSSETISTSFAEPMFVDGERSIVEIGDIREYDRLVLYGKQVAIREKDPFADINYYAKITNYKYYFAAVILLAGIFVGALVRGKR